MKHIVILTLLLCSALLGRSSDLEEIYDRIAQLPGMGVSQSHDKFSFIGLTLHDCKMVQIRHEKGWKGIEKALTPVTSITAEIPSSQFVAGGFNGMNLGIVYFQDQFVNDKCNVLVINEDNYFGITTVILSKENAEFVNTLYNSPVYVGKHEMTFIPVSK